MLSSRLQYSLNKSNLLTAMQWLIDTKTWPVKTIAYVCFYDLLFENVPG